MEEERRLCYVGITRAKQRLYLLRAFKRNLMGGANTNLESRFLKDIPDHLIDSGRRPQGNEKKLSNWDDETLPVVDLPELKTGDRVRHNQFGEGIVVDYQPVRDDAEVVVEFQWSGVKKLLFSFARLEKMG